MMSNLDRLTEYHNGVAVIRDKNKLKEAMEKLASYEDVEEDSDMDKITTEFAEFICDKLCKYPCVCNQEELDEHCDECKVGKFICDICNSYNKINTFVGSQLEKIMIENNRLKNELQEYEDLEEQGLLLKLPLAKEDAFWEINRGTIPPSCYKRYAHSYQHCVYVLERLGKTCFLTKAEAEKALEDMKGE